MTLNTLFRIQKTVFMTQITLFVKKKKHYFTAFMVAVENNSERPVDALAVEKGESLTH